MTLPVYVGSSSGFGEGGLGGHMAFVSRAARAAGMEVNVVSRGRADSLPFTQQSVPPPIWEKWAKWTPLRWSPALRTYWAGRQFDRVAARMLPDRPIIYHSFPGFAEQSFRKVKERGGITVLEAATTHAEYVYAITKEEHRKFNIGGNPFSAAWVRQVLREYGLADYITVASELQRSSFIERGFPAEKLLYAPLGIDTERFSSMEQGCRPRKANDPFTIIQVGQISLRKGFLYLLDAVAQLNNPRIEVVLFGGIGWRGIGQAIDRYRSKGLNIRQISGDPLPFLRESHLYVHSSVEDGFGLAPLEAMATGLPVIVTEHTGMKDLIADGTDGCIVTSRNSESLAEAIAVFIRDEEKRLAMGRSAALKARQYDTSACTLRYAEALRPVWSSAGRAGPVADRPIKLSASEKGAHHGGEKFDYPRA